MPTTTKTRQVAEHLLKNKTITSLEAIRLYAATRLSAIIHTLRHKHSWIIDSVPMTIKDKNGQTCTYSKYTLIVKPKNTEV